MPERLGGNSVPLLLRKTRFPRPRLLFNLPSVPTMTRTRRRLNPQAEELRRRTSFSPPLTPIQYLSVSLNVDPVYSRLQKRPNADKGAEKRALSTDQDSARLRLVHAQDPLELLQVDGARRPSGGPRCASRCRVHLLRRAHEYKT